MFFDWFNSKTAEDFGVKLANDLSKELKKSKVANSKLPLGSEEKILQIIFTRVGGARRTDEFNFYKKSKLANEFKWRLLALEYPEEFVDGLTKALLLCMNR